MLSCLDDDRIRAIADDEGREVECEHVNSCVACRSRVDAARRQLEEFTALASTIAVPRTLKTSVPHALAAHQTDSGGATTLRRAPVPWWTGRAWLPAGVAVAAAILVFVFLVPGIDAPRELSAAEILGRSLQTLAPVSGTELREFDLQLQLPRMASVPAGTYRIVQVVDHDTPGRYGVSRYAPDGTLLDALSEDPVTGRRRVLIRIDGQAFVFDFGIDASQTLALRDLERHHVEAMIRVLQATAGQTVTEAYADGDKQYVVELPQVTDTHTEGFWDLQHARVVIDAGDYQILEMAASGSYMSEPVSISFRLRRRFVGKTVTVAPNAFEVPAVAGAIRIEGTATADLGRDILVSTLRELLRARR